MKTKHSRTREQVELYERTWRKRLKKNEIVWGYLHLRFLGLLYVSALLFAFYKFPYEQAAFWIFLVVAFFLGRYSSMVIVTIFCCFHSNPFGLREWLQKKDEAQLQAQREKNMKYVETMRKNSAVASTYFTDELFILYLKFKEPLKKYEHLPLVRAATGAVLTAVPVNSNVVKVNLGKIMNASAPQFEVVTEAGDRIIADNLWYFPQEILNQSQIKWQRQGHDKERNIFVVVPEGHKLNATIYYPFDLLVDGKAVGRHLEGRVSSENPRMLVIPLDNLTRNECEGTEAILRVWHEIRIKRKLPQPEVLSVDRVPV